MLGRQVEDQRNQDIDQYGSEQKRTDIQPGRNFPGNADHLVRHLVFKWILT